MTAGPNKGNGSPPPGRLRRERASPRGGRRADEAAENIRRHIIRHCHSGQMLPSERDWADRLGVSRKTVRNALLNLADEGWLTKRAGQGFRVGRARRKLTGATGLFYLAEPVHLLLEPFYCQMFLGVTEVASSTGQGLISFFGHSSRSPAVTPATFWEPNLQVVDSLLILGVFNRDLIAHAAEVHPVVCLDVDYGVPGVSFASFDHGQSLKLAAKYLIDLGHRRIGYVGRTVSNDPAVAARVAGYHEAMAWAGLPGDEHWLIATRTPQASEAVVERWLRMPAHRRPTALIVADNFWPVLARATQMGVRVPDQLSVIAIGVPQTWYEFVNLHRCESELPAWKARPFEHAFSSGSLDARMAPVRPTTIALPARAMGQWGMHEVRRRIAQPDAAAARELFQADLVAGSTTAQPGPG